MSVHIHERIANFIAGDCPPPLPESPLVASRPVTDKEMFLTLLEIYDVLGGPLDRVGSRARWASHPSVAAVKMTLEDRWMRQLDAMTAMPPPSAASTEPDPVRAIRSLAAKDRLPAVYRWVAEEANLDELRLFLAIEGGPDGGFDDLVAACQIGLSGAAKMELARNYWDEMGNGNPAEVHTDLHRQTANIVGVPTIERQALTVPALQRAALGGLLATNRWLQPEMIGALGLTELQAGPRCRLVLAGFTRLGLPEAAQRFYRVHADVDPRHGKDWLQNAIAPLAKQSPDWSARMIRGAQWRWTVNARLFDDFELSHGRVAA